MKPFGQHPVIDGMYVMSPLALTPGSTVFVTVRATNMAGLYAIGTSESVVISPEPRLEVLDGEGETDMDGQIDLHVLQGSWRYSDPCPVLSAEWSVKELGGKDIIGFEAIPDKSLHFYNDDLHLQNFKTYVNYVRITDALKRTVTAYSDGITVLARLPDPAMVRDGLSDEDHDFQEPVDRVSANWDVFGNPRSTLPSDHIIRYEAAVGTDRKYAATRSNVHGFEVLGLSTNVSFFGLNLAAKSVTYYVTVRAFSAGGSYVESSSNGIKVGYRSNIVSGQVQVERYQSSTNTIRFSWTDFKSDMLITHYYSGVSSENPSWDNSTHKCSEVLGWASVDFDVGPLLVLDAQFMAVVGNISLIHGGEYYVGVIAVDQMGQCCLAVSEAIFVDTTPPVAGQLTTNGFDSDLAIFLHSSQNIIANFTSFVDPDSGIESADVDLVSSQDCSPTEDSDKLTVISTLSAKNESLFAFRDLDLREGVLYYLRTTITNGARLQTRFTSRPLLLDLTPPLPGTVKLTTSWTAGDNTFQSKTDTLKGMIALRSLSTQIECTTQVNLLDSDFQSRWTKMGGDFSEDCVGFHASELQVLLRHNHYLTGVDKGAAQFTKQLWREGDYVFRLTPAVQDKILSGIALASPSIQPPFLAQNGIDQDSHLPCDPSEQLCLEDGNSTTSERSLKSDADCGVGLTFMKINGKEKVLFWVQDELQLKQAWIPLDYSPSGMNAEYVLRLKKEHGNSHEVWSVSAFINGAETVSVGGLMLSGDAVLNVYTWNIEDFFPQVTDPLNPFKAVSTLSAVSVPAEQRPMCSYGAPFQDPASGIKDILLGVSDSYNETANVAPFKVFKSFCMPCLLGCDAFCSVCKGNKESDLKGFTVLPLTVDGLHLQAADVVFNREPISSNHSQIGTTVSTLEELNQFELPTYYLDVRVMDHSGQVTDVKSVGLVVDTSPPVINYVRCFDPHHSRDEAIFYLGNKQTVGATWDASEDISDILEVRISLGMHPGLGDVVPWMPKDKTQTAHIFTNLQPPLKEGGVYYVTVEVKNEAGLTSQAWSNFTVETILPDMSALTLQQPNVTSVTYSGVELGLMEGTDHLEINLDLNPAATGVTNVEYYGMYRLPLFYTEFKSS